MDFTIFCGIRALAGDVIGLKGFCFDLMKKCCDCNYNKFDRFVSDVMFFVYAWFNRFDRFFLRINIVK